MVNYDVTTLIAELRHALALAESPEHDTTEADPVVFEIAGHEFELSLFHDVHATINK